MEQTVHAIVLRRRDSGEADRRLNLLTQELGRIDAVAKGARKAASRLAGSSDPLVVAVMNLAEGKRNRFVTQAQPITSFRGLRRDYDRLSFGLALAELFIAVLPVEEPAPDAYDLLLRSLAMLEVHEKPLVSVVWSQVHLLSLSGFLPQVDACVVRGTPVAESKPFLSPDAGGYVCDEAAGTYTDRIRVRREVLIGLHRVSQIDQPPSNLRHVEETLLALMPFWRHVAAVPLPANEGVVGELTHRMTQV